MNKGVDVTWQMGLVLVLAMRMACADPVTLQGEVLQKGSGDPTIFGVGMEF